jgi:hypothetical protein
MQDKDVSIGKLSFPKGRHRSFPRYPIVHLPCPDSSGFRRSRSESVLTSDRVYHSLKFGCKFAAFSGCSVHRYHHVGGLDNGIDRLALG